MENKTKILIDLWKKENSIFIDTKFIFNKVLEQNFEFHIADSLIIDKVSQGENDLEYAFTVEKLQFREPSKKIEILKKDLKEFDFSYYGKTESYHTLYEEDILAINFYSAWYPMELPNEVEYLVKIHLDDTFHVINGEYNNDEKVWYYKPIDFDLNIIALKNHETMISENVVVYYYDKSNDKNVTPYFENYNKISDYFIELYGNNKTQKTNIVLLPKGNKFDGYIRDSLIVFGGIREDYDGIVHLLAHEIAHSWCTGAKAETWEDWLNETFAEWSALLYEIEVTGNSEKFNKIIEEKQSNFPELQPLKTEDSSRPQGVHDNGVLHLYKLYCSQGVKPIKLLLKTFDSLEEKTTETLVQTLNKNGEIKLAEYILNMVTY